MKKQGLLILVLAALYFIARPSSDVQEELSEILEEMESAYSGSSISVGRHNQNINDLSTEGLARIEDLMDRADFRSATYGCNEDCCSGVFFVDNIINFIGPRWYYQYSSDGRIEDDIVESIDEALEERGEHYFYCERYQEENWFYCTSNG